MMIKENLGIFCNKIAIIYYKFLKNFYRRRAEIVAEKGTLKQRIKLFLERVDKFLEEGARDMWMRH